jgi:hypothetical protein
MSMTTAPAFERTPRSEHFRTYRGKLWRIVEAQHRISTNRLAAGTEDQALLEQLVEEVKPSLPVSARHLHYLLATPFRYGHKSSSRFRRAGEKPGIFYAAESVATAIAETAYWRLRFYSRSPDFQPPSTTVEHSAISVTVVMYRMLDLCAPPYLVAASLWMAHDDYSACQLFAAEARVIDTQALRYASVRDPHHRANVAIFDASVFGDPAPRNAQTWHFRYEQGELTAFGAFPSNERFSFRPSDFGL